MKTSQLSMIVIAAFVGFSTMISSAAEFEYTGVQFSYDDTLAGHVVGEHVPAEPLTHGLASLETGSPEHIRVSFDHDAPPGIFDPHNAQLLIFPVEDYRVIFEVVANTIDTLQNLLVERPDSIEGAFPFLPPMPSTKLFGAKMKYIDFQNGSGVRYLLSYREESSEEPSTGLFYTYQGLATDRRYYVSFVFQVAASTESETDVRRLEVLDMLIQSLSVMPDHLGNS